MNRTLAALAAGTLSLLCASAPAAAAAQTWNDERTLALVTRATERRAQQLADTALVDYTARAHGYVAFLAQLGEGFREPPKIVKADELALEVYWKAPNLSKQRIVGRRDTLLLPTDIAYHRDHLGIVQNNFPSIIRLGEGDEVRDVPHPLSAAGLGEYEFAIRDSLRIQLPDHAVNVYEVRVRPRDDRQPRVVGAVYIDRETAEVVRMAFNFTRASFVDDQLEDLAIVLENALVNGRFWLPLRQEIEIRRAGKWLDYPARGIIRGRWEVCCYEVNRGLPSELFAGYEIVTAPSDVLARHGWTGAVLDSLPPDVRAPSDEEVRRVQEEARMLVRSQALAKTSGAAVSARRLSDFVRVNRVEGFAFGAGTLLRAGSGVSVRVSGRWGIDDREAKGRLAVAWRRASGLGLELFAERSYRDVGDAMETSLVRNSLAAQEYGSDYSDPFDVRGIGLAVELPERGSIRWRAEGALERHDPLAVRATPSRGRYEPTVPALTYRLVRSTLTAERPTRLWWLGSELRWRAELRVGRPWRSAPTDPEFARLFLSADVERPLGAQRLVARLTLGGVTGSDGIAAQEYLYLGGPSSGPGYRFHEFVGRIGASQHVEWRAPVPFIAIPLGRFGRVPPSATIAPFAHAVYVDRAPAFAAPRQGWYPAVGIGVQLLFDLLRVDVARGLRDGRWTFSVDVARDLWGIL